jgi:tRNA nucleotidyltransferase (CCA-adding enzyme)
MLRASLKAGRNGQAELKVLDRYLREWRHTKLEITGDDLQRLGFTQGPELGKALRETLDARVNGELRGRDEELAFAAARLQGQCRQGTGDALP